MPLFRRRADRDPDVPGPDVEQDREDSPAQLTRRLDEAITSINRAGGELPALAWVQARHLTDTLARIIALAGTGPLDVRAAILVHRTLTDYLPTTLAAYLAVPPDARHVPTARGAVPDRLLVDQLGVLQDAAQRTLADAADDDIAALLTQGAFLTTKFTRSDLDLP